MPEGLEIYLDAIDITPTGWLVALKQRLERLSLPAEFVLLVEGPLRSLDGDFFDLSADSAANREVVKRICEFGAEVGARAACVHLIAPTDCLSRWNSAGVLERCLPLTTEYARMCVEAGMVPTVENIPPIARMRESRYMTSPIGGPPEDLAWLARQVPGLRLTVDTSHAELFLNAARAEAPDGRFADIVRACRDASEVRSLREYLGVIAGLIETAHVSDADGLLGEGLPYGSGTAPLDDAVRILVDEARWLVTEVLEPDPNRSDNMRRAEARIATLRRAAPVAR